MGNLFEDWDNGIAPPTQLLTGAPTLPNVPKATPREATPRSEPAPAQGDNIFAKWDAGEAPKLYENLKAQREQEVADYRAKLQAQNESYRDYYKSLPPMMQEEHQGLQDYLNYHAQTAVPPLPPPEKGGPPGNRFKAEAFIDLVNDPETKRRILAETLFPHDPDGYARVGFDVDGKPVYIGDDRKLHRISTGMERFSAQMVANSPEMIAGTAGAFGSPLMSAVAATTAHELKRGAAGLIWDEPQTYSGNLKEMGTEFGMNLAGEGLGRAMGAAANRGRMVELSPEEIKRGVETIARVKKDTGVDLTLAQALGDPQLIALQAFLSRNPDATAKLMIAHDVKARGQFSDYVDKVMDAVSSSPLPAEAAGRKGINAAEAAIMLERRAAQQRVDPLYRAAYANTDAVMDPAVIQFFRHPEFRQAFRKGEQIARLEDEAAKTKVNVTTTRREPVMPPMSAREVPEMRVREVPGAPGAPEKPPGLTADQPRLGYERGDISYDVDEAGNLIPRKDQLPAVREDLPLVSQDKANQDLVVSSEGDIIPRQRKYEREKNPNRPGYTFREVQDTEQMNVPSLRGLDYTKRGLDRMIEELSAQGKRQEARALRRQRTAFVQALDNLDNPAYKAARSAWQKELADNIEPLENGVVGVLARIKDPMAHRAAQRVFRGGVTDTMIADAKKAIPQKDWDPLVRSWLSDQWDKAQRVSRTNTPENVNAAGALHQRLFGTPDAEKSTMAMLGPKASDVMKKLMDTAESLKQTPIAGSNTFRDTEIQKSLETMGSVGAAFLSPRITARNWMLRRAARRAGAQIFQALTDPTKVDKLSVVLRMKPSTRRNILIGNIVGAQTARDYAGSRMPQGPNSELVAGYPDTEGEEPDDYE